MRQRSAAPAKRAGHLHSAGDLDQDAAGTVIGPLLVGLNKPVQIVSLNAKDSDIVNMAAIAAYSAGGEGAETADSGTRIRTHPF
jgi:hypothetical protein